MRTRGPLVVVPNVDLPSSAGGNHELATHRGSLVLVFIPDLRSALRALQPFDRRLHEFARCSCHVLGVADETVENLRRFAAEHDLRVELLSDAGGSLFSELNLRSACHPVVLLVDGEGVVRESMAYPDVNPDGVLDTVGRMGGARAFPPPDTGLPRRPWG